VSACRILLPICFELESPLSSPFEEIDDGHRCSEHFERGPSPAEWFWQFLKEELAPYPGRAELVARIVIAATIVMILTMTFRIPFGAYAAIYTFLISRESPRQTAVSAMTEVVVICLRRLYILVGAMLFVNHPMFRLLWIIATLFIMFYA